MAWNWENGMIVNPDRNGAQKRIETSVRVNEGQYERDDLEMAW
jgi:hypothetical protein